MIDLTESVDEGEIARAAADVLAGLADEPPARRWSAAAELGWLGLGVPEENGGVGFGLAEQAALFRELGRAVADGPFLGAALGARLAVAAGAEVPAELLDGSLRVAVGAQGEPEPSPARRWHAVVDEVGAGSLLLLDRTGPSRIVRLADVRVVGEPGTLDTGSRVWTVEVDPAAPVLLEGVADGLLDTARVLVAATLVGLAEQARDDSVRHATQREQYGRPIGSFQAVKHRCADMAVRAAAAWSLTSLAVVELAAGEPAGAFDAVAAQTVARDAALSNGRDNIQNHGAMGFAAEYRGHRFVTRAQLVGLAVDPPAEQRRLMLAAASPW